MCHIDICQRQSTDQTESAPDQTERAPMKQHVHRKKINTHAQTSQ